MTTITERQGVHAALEIAIAHLCGRQTDERYWEGRLSSSALATAVAVSALALAGQEPDTELIARGIDWLCRTQNADGGWGDSPDSPSNLSTTLLCVSALILAEQPAEATLHRADAYITALAGPTPEAVVAALTAIYGEDRTFAVPILMNCALAGLIPWEAIPGLPFELAVVPQRWYRALRLHVVSYALPALIAVGMILHHHHPPESRWRRLLRRLAVKPALARLQALQPEHGGFLEATPLTAFVAMSLIPLHGHRHPVAWKCLRFLRASVRADGSWPIDTNLSVWLTSGAVQALAQANRFSAINPPALRGWIVERQYQAVHPFTGAAPGGWGWTHLPGGVPDADDTAGAMLALVKLGDMAPLRAGATWLLGLQNSDGGWPTFCRGWGKLPFDKSSPDLTAHALRALHAADQTGADDQLQMAITRGMRYLQATQRADGAWVPLWFGSQRTVDGGNPLFGTARTLLAYAELDRRSDVARRGVDFLVASQGEDGSWGAERDVAPSIEETALALTALSYWRHLPGMDAVVTRGASYLAACVQDGTWRTPTPLGLYFASLWYSEDLYPVIWTVEALGRALATDDAPPTC